MTDKFTCKNGYYSIGGTRVSKIWNLLGIASLIYLIATNHWQVVIIAAAISFVIAVVVVRYKRWMA